MTLRWRNSAVAIVTHKNDGGQLEGTGMLVAPNLILTACHVVKHDDAKGKVRLRWNSGQPDFSANSGDSNNGYHEAIEEDDNRGIVWFDADLDLALIKCNSPNDVIPVQLSAAEPHDAMRWSAEAFPQIGENYWKDSCHLSGIAGSCVGRGSTARFTLQGHNRIKVIDNVNSTNEITNLADWSGASGASVLNLDGHFPHIIGVIVTEYLLFETALDAVPINEALKNAKFREVLYSHKQITHQKCISELLKYLVRLAALPGGKELMQEHFAPILSATTELKNMEAVAKNLTSLSLSEALNAVCDIYEGATDYASVDSSPIQECARLLACAVVTVATGQQICPMNSSDSQGLLEMKCGSKTGVEIGMASYDGRMPEFRERRQDGELPEGRYSLESQPEQGAGQQNVLVDMDVGRLMGSDILAAIKEKEGTPAPEEFLKTKKRRGKPSYYLPFPVSDSQSLEQCITASGRINLPHVSIATYNSTQTAVESDEEQFGVLREMLPLRTRKGDD